MADYSMYKFFKGEKKSPFESGSIADHFWFYESVFDSNFNKMESSDWYDFFDNYNLSKKFMKLLTPDDYNKPSDKKGVFDLWLKYLFDNKLPKTDEELYHATTVK